MSFDFKSLINSVTGEGGVGLDTVISLINAKNITADSISKIKELFLDMTSIVKLPEVDKLLKDIGNAEDKDGTADKIKAFFADANNSEVLKSALIPVIPKIIAIFNTKSDNDSK